MWKKKHSRVFKNYSRKLLGTSRNDFDSIIYTSCKTLNVDEASCIRKFTQNPSFLNENVIRILKNIKKSEHSAPGAVTVAIDFNQTCNYT